MVGTWEVLLKGTDTEGERGWDTGYKLKGRVLRGKGTEEDSKGVR